MWYLRPHVLLLGIHWLQTLPVTAFIKIKTYSQNKSDIIHLQITLYLQKMHFNPYVIQLVDLLSTTEISSINKLGEVFFLLFWFSGL